ncbi:S-adenosyl-L-methionine-dependent methyltransferase [Penicillium capsulatum]|uniref:S-adenosyl-L-methionine-dependent methyltransferase n=1 Tax=Penicillium capsulatum TaxID=69766 RepID=A0A9W9IMJ3_9EURO|nr:S-adenosyl-L-methionine-dependent methyltransferase [Penicillium capsulatum]
MARARPRVMAPPTGLRSTILAPTGCAPKTTHPPPGHIFSSPPFESVSDHSSWLDPDEEEADPGFNCGDSQADTVSVSSTIYRGLVENGRRYQVIRENEYWLVSEGNMHDAGPVGSRLTVRRSPADDLQFESLEAGHAVAVVLESDMPNPYSDRPSEIAPSTFSISEPATGYGPSTSPTCFPAVRLAPILPAESRARSRPAAIVRGVDIFPPPVSWVPPNCILEVDDVVREWTWDDPFDFIHLRIMIGAFTPDEWDQVYRHCYQNLKPGGWIEQLELDAHLKSDDGSIVPDSMAATWGETTFGCAERSGRRIDTMFTMRASIEAAGFVNAQERDYKWPIGGWPKNRELKEAGLYNYQMWSSGIEGWGLWLLTKFGAPEPWPAERVHAYVGKIRSELQNPRVHGYQMARRVWAQKPMNEDPPQPKRERSDS